METNTAPDSDIKFRKHVTPKGAVIQAEAPCLFTISVGAAKQSVNDLVSAYLWGRERYNVRGVLLGDGLYRITLRICHALPDAEAHRESKSAGECLKRQFLHEACVDDIEVFKTSDIFLQQNFRNAHQRIIHLYRSQPQFRDFVVADASAFVERQQKNGTLNISKIEAIRLSKRYLLQEFAVYLVMAEDGWLTEIYLGREIQTLAKIMNGEIPDAPSALRQRVNIGLEKKVRKHRLECGLRQAA